MARNFAEIAFTESVKARQEKYGSRRSYARMEATVRGTEIGENEAAFIAEQDGFYLATVSETGQPYVQFRGGPKGFLKVLDAKTLAYADFRGLFLSWRPWRLFFFLIRGFRIPKRGQRDKEKKRC